MLTTQKRAAVCQAEQQHESIVGVHYVQNQYDIDLRILPIAVSAQ